MIILPAMEEQFYRVWMRGVKKGSIKKKPLLRRGFSFTEEEGRTYFHHKEDQSDDQDFISSDLIARIEPAPPPPDLDYQFGA
jgi:hypothetical protein